MAVVQTAMLAGLPYAGLQDAIFAHPTMAEGLNTLLGNLPSILDSWGRRNESHWGPLPMGCIDSLRGEYVDTDVDQVPVTNNQRRRRFEVRAGDRTATLTYMVQGDRITLIHTEVPKELEGHGLGGKLAAFGLDYARENGLRVVPTCPFVAAYIKRHPQYADLVAPAASQ